MKIIIFLISFLISFSAYAEKINYDLDSLHKNQISKNLRKVFEHYSNHPEELKNKINFDSSHLKMLEEKFLILQISKGDFGGNFISVFFAPKNMSHKFYIWKVWLYKTDKEKFEIRSIVETPIKKSDEDQFLELLSDKNKIYWI